MPSRSILKVSVRQIKAARALLAWSQEQLAAAANVSVPTIKRLEAHDGPLRAVAELVGIEGGVVSGVINLESSGVEASDRRPRHDDHYHEA
jgi:DNA-binding XRE family transcriptional regulator